MRNGNSLGFLWSLEHFSPTERPSPDRFGKVTSVFEAVLGACFAALPHAVQHLGRMQVGLVWKLFSYIIGHGLRYPNLVLSDIDSAWKRYPLHARHEPHPYVADKTSFIPPWRVTLIGLIAKYVAPASLSAKMWKRAGRITEKEAVNLKCSTGALQFVGNIVNNF